MGQKTTRWLLAAVQAIIGWEWVMTGGNKLLAGIFPRGLAGTLTDLLKNTSEQEYGRLLVKYVLDPDGAKHFSATAKQVKREVVKGQRCWPGRSMAPYPVSPFTSSPGIMCALP